VRKKRQSAEVNGRLGDLKGNLAQEGCVVKLAGHNILNFAARRVYLIAKKLRSPQSKEPDQAGDVVVIRYEGPKAARVCAKC